MKVNIFGVGRSGTKAVQLYTAYHMARHFGEIWFNYEPYQHLTRKGIVNYRGVNHDLQSKKIMGHADELSASHRRFLKDLVDHKAPTITKFIRGNGRLSQINSCMNPELTILVVRNVYQVLASVIQMPWNFYSFGSPSIKMSYRNFLGEMVKEALERGLIDDSILKSANFLSGNRLLDNALYWYIMNLSALDSIDNDTMVLRYEEMDQLPELLNVRRPDIFPGDDNIRDAAFIGKNIHGDQTIRTLKPKVMGHKVIGVSNELLFSLCNRIAPARTLSIPIGSGEMIRTSNFFVKEPKSSIMAEKMRLKVLPHPVVDRMQERIESMVISKRTKM